jgi:hypothetical protein
LLGHCASEQVFGITILEVINEVTHRLMVAEALGTGVIKRDRVRDLRGKRRKPFNRYPILQPVQVVQNVQSLRSVQNVRGTKIKRGTSTFREFSKRRNELCSVKISGVWRRKFLTFPKISSVNFLVSGDSIGEIPKFRGLRTDLPRFC